MLNIQREIYRDKCVKICGRNTFPSQDNYLEMMANQGARVVLVGEEKVMDTQGRLSKAPLPKETLLVVAHPQLIHPNQPASKKKNDMALSHSHKFPHKVPQRNFSEYGILAERELQGFLSLFFWVKASFEWLITQHSSSFHPLDLIPNNCGRGYIYIQYKRHGRMKGKLLTTECLVTYTTFLLSLCWGLAMIEIKPKE